MDLTSWPLPQGEFSFVPWTQDGRRRKRRTKRIIRKKKGWEGCLSSPKSLWPKAEGGGSPEQISCGQNHDMGSGVCDASASIKAHSRSPPLWAQSGSAGSFLELSEREQPASNVGSDPKIELVWEGGGAPAAHVSDPTVTNGP